MEHPGQHLDVAVREQLRRDEVLVPARVAYHSLPVVLVVTFSLVAVLSGGHAASGILVFALAGLGCSALPPSRSACGEQQGERPTSMFTATLTELATGTGTAVLTAPAYPTTSPRPRSPPPAGSAAIPTCAWS